ncbi:response regulator transcription factor [Fervidibacillus halotolerans]|uniref:Response regulator transcription factor n=1 Tax=Fervidibacillus halotolerans TaxID=2980027 RepID=A0A9E8LYB8_9BACI|nr:response regulator transcription factor [Fervidibacillus halotolerans]WAA11811.1 response regulator transcription factor [Fervidibacillus halotolerans]
MIRLLIAEDQRMLRGALASLLALEDDIDIVAEVDNGRDAIEIIKTLKPDISLLDIEMPMMSGLEVAEEVKREGMDCRIIILTTFARPGYFERALKANVSGYLLKDGSIEELVAAIRNVMKGKKIYSQELMIASITEENPLTGKEIEILQLSARGKSTKDMAKILYLSPGTIRNYLSEINQKLGTKNRIEAIAVAEEKGWL